MEQSVFKSIIKYKGQDVCMFEHTQTIRVVSKETGATIEILLIDDRTAGQCFVPNDHVVVTFKKTD